jgi:hypothetical protein
MRQIADPTRYGKYAVTVQTILRFPDHHLRATAQRVVVFDEDLCSLATDLLDTLRAESAIGQRSTQENAQSICNRALGAIEAAEEDAVAPFDRSAVTCPTSSSSRYGIRHQQRHLPDCRHARN